MSTLRFILVFALLTLVSAAFAASYQDPHGRFSFDVPSGWSVTATDDGAMASDGVASYARIVKVAGGGKDMQLVKRVTDQIATQWQDFKQGQQGSFTLSGARGVYVFFSGINPKGVKALMRVVAAPFGDDAYMIILSCPVENLDAMKAPVQQIESSFKVAAAGTAPVIGDTAPPQVEGATGWKEHYDARLHVGITLPAGWTMKTEGYTLVAQSPDHASLVLAEAFAAKTGETAKTHLSTLSARHAALLSHAQVSRTAPQPNAGDTLVAALSYKTAAGQAGQARALCSVFKNSGMLYAIAAPDGLFTHERPMLLKVLHSLRFGSPTGEAAPPPASPAVKPARGVVTATVDGVKFVKWTDPKEHAFTIDVPEGWGVEGGMFRVESSDTRVMLRLTAPGNDMLIQMGDKDLPQHILTPSPRTLQTYHVPEGVLFSPNHTYQNMIFRYMPALEFNKWYLDLTLKADIEDFAITQEKELPEIARQKSEAFTKREGASIHIECSTARTEFKGRSKSLGKPILGAIGSTTGLVTSSSNPSMPMWSPEVTMMACLDDAKGQAHLKLLQTLAQHMGKSFQTDAAWSQKQNQLVNRETARIAGQAQQHVQMIGELSKQMAVDSEARRKSSMGAYWNHVAQGNETQRKFLNHISDNTDVRNPNTGEAYKVGGGYSNYYHDPRTGTILGTNSTDRPPVDFTPMEQF